MKKFNANSHETLLKKIRDIPSLPEVVNRIIQLLGKPNTPASQIADLIAFDPGLTSKALRMVNSAAFGFQRQISSVQHAIMILGFNTVRGLVLSTSIFKMLANKSAKGSLDQKDVWEHSIAVAMASKVVAKFFNLKEVDDAFSAGMLHDVGKMVLDLYFTTDYIPVAEAAKKLNISPHGKKFLALEKEILGMNHTEIGASLALKWKLPVALNQVIEFHHTPERAKLCQSLVYSVALANEMCQFLNLENYWEKDIREFCTPEILAYFSLEQELLEQLLKQVDDELSESEEMLQAFASF
ncbi:MAG: HDOD domain-containing protein [Cyanobacteria bacterium]|nr:HDOD domain-containing protein [Cyanobacteriota bacterium]